MNNLIAAAVPQSTALAREMRTLNLEDRALVQVAQTLRAQNYRFVTVSPATHARVNSRIGNEWAGDLVDIFGWSRPFRADLLPSSLFNLMRAAAILKPAGRGWCSTVRFSTLTDGRGDVLLAHSSHPTADVNAVFFGPDTYRFCNAVRQFLRADSRPVRRALDLGCGSGAAAILIAHTRSDAEVLASDINGEALRLARVNAVLADAVGVSIHRSDLFAQIDGEFDLIVANPPFLLDPSRRRYRHGGGRRGEGLSLAMVAAALPRLRRGGTLLLYTGVAIVDGVDPLLEELEPLLSGLPMHWDYRELDPDIFGEELEEGAYLDADRIAAVVLTATSLGPMFAAHSPAGEAH